MILDIDFIDLQRLAENTGTVELFIVYVLCSQWFTGQTIVERANVIAWRTSAAAELSNRGFL